MNVTLETRKEHGEEPPLITTSLYDLIETLQDETRLCRPPRGCLCHGDITDGTHCLSAASSASTAFFSADPGRVSYS